MIAITTSNSISVNPRRVRTIVMDPRDENGEERMFSPEPTHRRRLVQERTHRKWGATGRQAAMGEPNTTFILTDPRNWPGCRILVYYRNRALRLPIARL